MVGIDRCIPGVPTPRLAVQDHSLATGANEDRRERLKHRCDLGYLVCFPQRGEGPSRRELNTSKDMKRSSYGSGFCLLERLVSSELYECQSEGIDLYLVVLHHGAEDIRDAGRPTLALEFGMVRRIGEDFHELN